MCPPSVALEETFPKEKESVYAQEGTHAHALAELILRYNNNEINKRTFNSKLKKLQENPLWTEEMQLFIEQYAHDVWEIVNEVKATCADPQVLFEQRLDFSAWVEEGFGTGDVVIISDDTIHIIDLKFGKGVGVSAINNPQLRLYGLGAVDTYGLLYDFNKVKMTIIQPRLDHTDSEELTVSELVEWAETEVKPKAELAYAGKGDFKAGDHCQFCKAKATCRARAEEQLKVAQYDFAEPPTLRPSEIADILSREKQFAKWIKDVVEYAVDMAVNKGVTFPGFKVVEANTKSKIKDPILLAQALKELGYTEGAIYKPQELKGITDLKKLLSKEHKEELNDHLIKPQGAPTLAPETDKRPVYQSVDQAKQDFDDDLLC